MTQPSDVPASNNGTALPSGLGPEPKLPISYDWKSHRKYVVFMIFVAYFLNSVDRNIISILQEPIKEEFQILDW